MDTITKLYQVQIKFLHDVSFLRKSELFVR